MRPVSARKRRKIMVSADLSVGALSDEEKELEDAPEASEDDLGLDGAASLLSIPIRRRKPAAPTASPATRGSVDLVGYWERLRAGRRFPSPTDIHRPSAVAAAPPGQLMTCSVDRRLILVDRILATPPSVAGRNQDLLGNGPHMSTVLDWLKQLGRAAARAGRPVERIEVFTVEGHNIRYQCVVLPFSRDQRNVDLLLCHLRAESTG